MKAMAAGAALPAIQPTRFKLIELAGLEPRLVYALFYGDFSDTPPQTNWPARFSSARP